MESPENNEVKVLLVDDDPDNLERTKVFLEKQNDIFNIITVTSGSEALRLLDKTDIIVSDYQMPIMDGLELLKKIRKEKNSDIPFIIFTGKGREEVAMKALNLGANRYLQKGEGSRSQFEILGNAIKQETERKKTKKEKQKSEKKYRRLVETTGDIIITHDKNGNIKFINQAGLDFSGYTEEEVKNKNIIEFIPKDEIPTLIKRKKKRIEEGNRKSFKYEITFINKNEERIDVNINATPIFKEDEFKKELVVARDITERKKTEKELRRSEKEKSLILENADEIITHHDKNHNIQWANQAYLETTGQTLEQVKGQKCYHAWGLDTPCKGCPVTKAIENGESFEAELTPRNQEHWPQDQGSWLIKASAIKDNKGNITGAVEVATDITERKKAEQRKDFLNTLLRQDLGSKYQTIQGYLQLIEEADLTEEYQEYLEKAIKAGKKVDEILGLANKLEEIEKTELEGRKNIVKALNQVTDDIKDLIKKEGVEIEKNYSKSLGRVKGDYSLNLIFSQILLTRTQISNCNNIRITAKEKEQEVLIKITDDGEKLPSDIKKMFTGGLYTGETTGVGGVRYHMIKQIAKHNKAKIEVKESDLDGSRFDIYLKKI